MTLKISNVLRQTPRALALAAATAAFGLGATAPAFAQTAAPEAVQTEFSDAKLDAFVTALQEVDAVRETFIPQIQAAEDESEQQQLIQQANVAISDTIEATPDITVEEYVTISQLAQEDPELNQRIVNRVEPAAD
jgi:DMSO/TMAO reductase YedYZ molybdopterin-dependent catalytic subunit